MIIFRMINSLFVFFLYHLVPSNNTTDIIRHCISELYQKRARHRCQFFISLFFISFFTLSKIFLEGINQLVDMVKLLQNWIQLKDFVDKSSEPEATLLLGSRIDLISSLKKSDEAEWLFIPAIYCDS